MPRVPKHVKMELWEIAASGMEWSIYSVLKYILCQTEIQGLVMDDGHIHGDLSWMVCAKDLRDRGGPRGSHTAVD